MAGISIAGSSIYFVMGYSHSFGLFLLALSLLCLGSATLSFITTRVIKKLIR